MLHCILLICISLRRPSPPPLHEAYVAPSSSLVTHPAERHAKMKLGYALAVMALPAATQAFAPAPVTQRNYAGPSALSMAADDGGDKMMGPERIAKSAISTLTASVLLASSVVGGPVLPIQSASAAPAASAAPVATKTAQPAKKAVPADPLAAEKKAVSEAKARTSEAQSKVSEAKKAAADVSKAASRDNDALAAAEKKAKSAKETLLQTNDKLAATKAKGNTADLKQVEQLGGKVGEYC